MSVATATDYNMRMKALHAVNIMCLNDGITAWELAKRVRMPYPALQDLVKRASYTLPIYSEERDRKEYLYMDLEGLG